MTDRPLVARAGRGLAIDAHARRTEMMTRGARKLARDTGAHVRGRAGGGGHRHVPLSDTGANTADPHLCDACAGPIMAIADATPVICSAGVASPCGLDLLGAAGVPVSREIRRQPGRRHRPAAGRGRAVPVRRRARAGAGVHRLLRDRHRADVLRRAAGVRSELPDQREHPAAARPQRDRGQPRPGMGGPGALADLPPRRCAARPRPAARDRLPGGALVPIARYDPAFTANGPGPSLLSALLLGDDEQDLRMLTALALPADVGCSAVNLDG